VPGPQVPLYLAGARMLTFHPLSIVIHGLALNITIQTYAGSVDFGIIGDKKAVPHVQDLADALVAAYEEALGLHAIGQAQAAAPVAAAPARKRVTKATPAKTPVPKTVRKSSAAVRKAATVGTPPTARKKAARA
jgi:diacylglycerol O-acyltransferase / wax synthase